MLSLSKSKAKKNLRNLPLSAKSARRKATKSNRAETESNRAETESNRAEPRWLLAIKFSFYAILFFSRIKDFSSRNTKSKVLLVYSFPGITPPRHCKGNDLEVGIGN